MGKVNTADILKAVEEAQPLWGPYVVHIAEKQVEPIVRLELALNPDGADTVLVDKAFGDLKHVTRTHLGILGFTVDLVWNVPDFASAVKQLIAATIYSVREG